MIGSFAAPRVFPSRTAIDEISPTLAAKSSRWSNMSRAASKSAILCVVTRAPAHDGSSWMVATASR